MIETQLKHLIKTLEQTNELLTTLVNTNASEPIAAILTSTVPSDDDAVVLVDADPTAGYHPPTIGTAGVPTIETGGEAQPPIGVDVPEPDGGATKEVVQQSAATPTTTEDPVLDAGLSALVTKAAQLTGRPTLGMTLLGQVGAEALSTATPEQVARITAACNGLI